jgi:hypothetical protein
VSIRNNYESIVALLLAFGVNIEDMRVEIKNRIERQLSEGFSSPFLRPVSHFMYYDILLLQ